MKTYAIKYTSQQLFLPDDANRVILKVEEGTNNSEYINASYVQVGFTIVSHTFTVEYGFLVNIKHTHFEFHPFQTILKKICNTIPQSFMIAIFKMCQIICQNKNNIQNFLSSISKCLFFIRGSLRKMNTLLLKV